MDITALKAELAIGHPGTGPYDSDAELAAGQLNAVNRTKNRSSMTASEVVNAFDSGEFNALTEAQQTTVWNVVHIGDINPFGIEATLLTSVFGVSSTTIENLAALRKDDVSRADEIGLGLVRPGNILEARK